MNIPTATTSPASRRLVVGCAIALLQGSPRIALADSGQVDGWCKVIESNIQRNEDDARRAHNSAETERLRDARRKLEHDAHGRRCPGH